ncbi:MAG: TrpR-like protein, YerC/YecD [Clostridia bacterium]|nr:TrpR-like protein, YerC/YecD [Clostridia bacterium]
MRNNQDESIEFLYRSIVSLETVEDCKNFLQDICTASELQEMSRRLKAAKMLSEGIVYSEIAAKTGLSTATISRVNHCLKYGNDGYHKVLEKMKLEEKKLLK